MPSRESAWLHESEPTHMDDLMVISRALAAANLVVLGVKPPHPEYVLTPELIEQANQAVQSIMQCRKRTLFRR